MRLFVVDDREMIRAAVRITLDHDTRIELVGEAADAREAVMALDRARPDLVLLDAPSTGESLRDAVATVRSAARAVVVFSANPAVDAVAAREAGAQGHIGKTIHPKELADALLSFSARIAEPHISQSRRGYWLSVAIVVALALTVSGLVLSLSDLI